MLVTALPLGRNCHLGVALVRHGNHLASALKWANITLAEVEQAIETEFSSLLGRYEIEVKVAAGHIPPGITLPREGGWAPIAEYIATPIPAEWPIDSLMRYPTGSLIHGVRLQFSEFRKRPEFLIEQNASKLAHLVERSREILSAGRFLALRCQESVSPDDAAHLQRIAKQLGEDRFLVVCEPETAMPEGVHYERMPVQFHPTNPFDLTGKQEAWMEILRRHDVERGGTPKGDYLF